METADAGNAVELVVKAGAATTALWTGYKIIKMRYKQFRDYRAKSREHQQRVEQMIDSFPILARSVEALTKEFSPNGGSSIRDQLDRIEMRQLIGRPIQKGLASYVGMIYFEVDAQGNWTDIANGLMTEMQCAPGDMLGRNWTTYVRQDMREEVISEWDRCVDGGLDFSMSFVFITKVGGHLHVNVLCKPVHNAKGAVVGFAGSINLQQQ